MPKTVEELEEELRESNEDRDALQAQVKALEDEIDVYRSEGSADKDLRKKDCWPGNGS